MNTETAVAKDTGFKRTSADNTDYKTGATRDTRSMKGSVVEMPQDALYLISRIYEDGNRGRGWRNWEYGMNIADLLERIALAIEGQLALQQKIYDMQIDPEAQAQHQAKVAQAAEKFFDPDRQGEQMAAVQIAAGKVVQQYQREHPLGVQFAPPQRRS